MSVPSANTRASRNVRSTASQPVIEKPASRLTGCAGLEMDLADRADHDAEKLQREERPGDRPQPVRVRGDERIARANRLNDREQPFQDHVVQRNRGEAKNGDRAQAHDHPLRIRRRRELERGHDPLLVGRDEQQSQDRDCHQPVQDDEDPQHDVRDRQRGGGRGLPGHVHHLDLSNNNKLFIEYRQVAYCNSITTRRARQRIRITWEGGRAGSFGCDGSSPGFLAS